MNITLRPYQLEAIEKIEHELYVKGVRSTALIASTGGGKSAILLALSKRFHERTGKHVLIVTHRVAVILQTAQRYADYYKLRCGLYGDHKQPNGDENIVMATIQTMHKAKALTKLKTIFENSMFGRDLDIGLIIVDESHMLGTSSYDKFLKMMPDIPYVGFSATQFRENKLSTALFESVAYQISMKDLIDQGYLVPPKLIQFYPTGIDHQELMSMSIALYQEQELGKSCVIFMRTKEQCDQLKNSFYNVNINSYVITDDTDQETRKDYFEAFEAGRVKVLISVDVLSEGVDLPIVETIFMPFQVGSVSRFMQRVGRGLRPFKGKTECRVYMAGVPPKLKSELYQHTGVQMLSLNKRQSPSDPFNEYELGEVKVEIEYATDANIKRIIKKAEEYAPNICTMIKSGKFPIELMGSFKDILGKLKHEQTLSLPATRIQIEILKQRGIEVPFEITNKEARVLLALSSHMR